MFAPTSKWGEARRQFPSHRSFFHLTSRGKALELDNKKSAGTYVCPDKQMGGSEEAVSQPPELFPFDLEGQGAGARQ